MIGKTNTHANLDFPPAQSDWIEQKYAIVIVVEFR